MAVFLGVVWLTQSLRVIDVVIGAGHGSMELLETALLLAPEALGVVLPISAFAAALYAMNRLFAESELVAMLAAGMSALALARPAALFGGALTLILFVVTLALQPLAARELRDRLADLRGDVVGALIFEGRFLHPSPGLTLFVRERRGDGEMFGVFVHDQRDPAAPVTYSARRAALTETREGPRLAMFEGAAQRAEPGAGLSLLRFESLVLDLGQFMRENGDRVRRPSERFLGELLFPTPEQLGTFRRGRFLAEAHERLSAPLYALALPLVAVAAVLGGGFRRRGYVGRLAAAVAIGVALRVLGLAAKAAIGGAAALWPLVYLPPLLGIAGSLWWLSSFGRRRPAAATAS